MVTPKPEGLRIATHFFNNEEDVDACVRALLEYRSDLPAGFDLRVGASFRSNDVAIVTTGRPRLMIPHFSCAMLAKSGPR